MNSGTGVEYNRVVRDRVGQVESKGELGRHKRQYLYFFEKFARKPYK